MLPGTIVHLTETASLSAGIDPDLNLFGIVLDIVDYKSVVDIRPEDNLNLIEDKTRCYRVLLSNNDIEIFYSEDLEVIDNE